MNLRRKMILFLYSETRDRQIHMIGRQLIYWIVVSALLAPPLFLTISIRITRSLTASISRAGCPDYAGSLDGCMAEQQVILLQVSAALQQKLRGGASEIVRRQLGSIRWMPHFEQATTRSSLNAGDQQR